ncbi:MAG: hypothetical protein ACREPZ_10215, partial [Rhodanobacteraceae bacterium]
MSVREVLADACPDDTVQRAKQQAARFGLGQFQRRFAAPAHAECRLHLPRVSSTQCHARAPAHFGLHHHVER